MLLWEAMSFPPYTVPAHSARGLTPNKVLHPSEKAWKFHSSGSNMSWTPSVHMGITISVQAWRWGIEHVFTLTGKAAHWHICAAIHSAWQDWSPCAFCVTAPGNTSRGNRGCPSLSEMCWDRRSFPCSCSRPSLLGRRRAAAGSQTQRNRKRDTCTPPGRQNTITSETQTKLT